jgi:uncharacterized iron-regulated protein
MLEGHGWRMKRMAPGAVTFALLSACATTRQHPPRPQLPTSVADLPFGYASRRDLQAPLVLDAVTETRTGALLTPAELAQRLTAVRVIFMGESHTSLDAHRAQARLIEAIAATGRPVLVGLEMFPRDPATDQALRAWTEGEIDEPAFLRRSHWYKHWGFPFGYYRDVFQAARRRHVPLFGVNAPPEVITAVRKNGFEHLSPAEKAHLPPGIVDTTSEEHRRLFRAFFAEGDTTHGAHLPDAAWEGMFRAQCTWDAVMSWNAARTLDARGPPGAIMVVLLGAGHVAFGLGATRQAAAAKVAGTASLIAVSTTDEGGRPARVRASYADYLWTIPPEPSLPPYPTLGVSVIQGAETPNPIVTMVIPDSPGARAGLRTNDVLLALDAEPVADKETLARIMADKSWGDAVRISIRRGEVTSLLTAVLRRTLPDQGSTPQTSAPSR